MSLLTNRRTVLAKIEATYGVDPSPTGALNAMLVKNLNVSPLQAELVSRDLIRPYLGNSEQLLATRFVQIDFEIEAVGAGVAGKVPAYDPLLKACGLEVTQLFSNISIEVTSGVATVTRGGHGYTGTGNQVTIAGATETLLNGEKAITVIDADSYSYPAPGVSDGPATGSVQEIIANAYSPISTDFPSVALYYNVDGVLHKILGARGTVELNFATRQIPVFRFQFTGLYTEPTDTAAPTVDFSAFQVPQVANTQNTDGFTLFGYSGNLESVNFNLACDVQYTSLIGEESVKLLNRAPAGALLIEAPTIAEKNYFQIAADTELGAMAISHGSRAGLKVSVFAPKVNLGNPTYQDLNGIQMLNIPYTANPDTGNDEILITIA